MFLKYDEKAYGLFVSGHPYMVLLKIMSRPFTHGELEALEREFPDFNDVVPASGVMTIGGGSADQTKLILKDFKKSSVRIGIRVIEGDVLLKVRNTETGRVVWKKVDLDMKGYFIWFEKFLPSIFRKIKI